MSILTGRSTEILGAGLWAALARAVVASLFRLITALMTTWHRHATIKALRELDDHTLRDIGLTRADIEDALRDTSSLDLWLQV